MNDDPTGYIRFELEDENNVKVDSLEGISLLIQWARSGGWVLSQAHKRIADKYGVATNGVIFTGLIPTYPKKFIYKRSS